MKRTAAYITLFLAAVLIFVLFHRIILNANQVSFAAGGDGLKSTYGMVYHIKHDTTYWHTRAMNYPFGESVFFTGNQVVLTNSLKLLADAGWDLSDYALGISNLLILFSFVLAALFIYLIFAELGMAPALAVPASLIIMLLSNQWERLGGHYNLAYAYVLPVILYLLIRFYRKPGYGVSALFGLIVLLFSAKQLYIAAFILVLWVPYWVFLPFLEKQRFGKPWFIISHTLVQFIVPFLLFNLFTGMHDPGLDRTAFPWGFYPSRIVPEAVFLPMELPHGQFLDFGNTIRSNSYVGLLGTVVAVVILVRLFTRLLTGRARSALEVTGHRGWDLLFWGSVLSLLIAMGIPFSPAWERLLNYTGPFRQLRAVGRFVFPFYYAMTITAFLFLWNACRNTDRKKLRTGLLVAVLLFTAFEAAMHIRTRPRRHYNPIGWHSGLYAPGAPVSWFDAVDPGEFQGIIPLPYYHIGSENYWVGDRSPAIVPSYAAAVRSGLPLNSVMLSRTSIRQTLMNLDLVYEPALAYPVLDHLPDERPFLVLRHRGSGLYPGAKRLVEKGTVLKESDTWQLLALPVDSIRGLIPERREELKELAEEADNRPATGMLFEDFSDREEGRFISGFTGWTPFFEGEVPDTGRYKISFWFEGAGRDLWPRTAFWTDLYDGEGQKYRYVFTDFFRVMVLRTGNWGLVEFPVHVSEPGTVIRMRMRNKVITGGEMQIDRILVRPESQVHLHREQDRLYVNNRPLSPPP